MPWSILPQQLTTLQTSQLLECSPFWTWVFDENPNEAKDWQILIGARMNSAHKAHYTKVG